MAGQVQMVFAEIRGVHADQSFAVAYSSAHVSPSSVLQILATMCQDFISPGAARRRFAAIMGVFEVMEGDTGEIGEDEVGGGFFGAVGIGEVVDIADGLSVGFVEVLAAGLVFGDEGAGPEEVDEFVLALEVFDGFFEGGDEFSGASEDGEEFVPEGLGIGAFAGGVFPFLGETEGVWADFSEAEGHGALR